MKKSLFALSLISLFSLGLSSCATIAPEERPIRPNSENSDLAFGANESSGGALSGALSQ